MSPLWPWGADQDDEDAEGMPPEPTPLQVRRAPCCLCSGRGWIWEVLTSMKTYR